MSQMKEGLVYNSDKDCCYQPPQAPEDRQAPGYHNDTPKNWLRGMGQYPCFDKKQPGK